MPNEQGLSPGVRAEEGSWAIQRRVISALFMREMLTRYGRNNIGFLWLFVEPMLFTLVVSIVWYYLRDLHGSKIPIVAFAVTGYASMMMWRNMPSRCIGAVRSNTALLFHRQVTIPDVFISRLALEIAAASTAFVALSLALTMLGFMPGPEDVLLIASGWLMLAWFGVGLGMTIGALAERFDFVGKLWSPMSYVLFPLSGTAFLVGSLPTKIQSIVLWLPMVHGVEAIRAGWFGSLFRPVYDLSYLAAWNLVLTAVGLAMVRGLAFDSSAE